MVSVFCRNKGRVFTIHVFNLLDTFSYETRCKGE